MSEPHGTRRRPSPETETRALEVRSGGDPRWQGQVPPRVEIRTASLRMPGILAFLLAIPLFLLLGVLAIVVVVLGAVGALLAPWIIRRMVRRMEDEVPPGDRTIELDPEAYREEARPQDRVAISRSSSSRSRGSTSE